MYWPRPSVKGQAWPKSKMATASTDGTQQADTSCTKRSSEEEVIITPEDSKLLEVISKLLISKKKGGSSKKNIINEAFKSLGLDENETEQLLNKLQTTNQIFSKKDKYFVVESKKTSENFGNQSYNGKHDHDGSEKVKSNLKNVDVKMKSLNCNDESDIANMKLPDSGLFLEDYFEFKEHVFNELNKMKALAHQDINNNLKQLREENNFLKSELQDKQAVINILLSDLQKDRFKISGKSQEPELLLPEKIPGLMCAGLGGYQILTLHQCLPLLLQIVSMFWNMRSFHRELLIPSQTMWYPTTHRSILLASLFQNLANAQMLWLIPIQREFK